MSINEIKEAFQGKQNVGETLKTIGGAAVNVGTDMVIGMMLAAGLCPKKGLKRAVGSLGIFMLSMKVGDIAEEYFYEIWDDLKEAFGTAKKEIEEAAREEAEENKEEE